MVHVLQVKQATEAEKAAPAAPAPAEGGSLIPGVDNSMLISALAGAGIGGIGGAALSKKNKLRNALIAALGGAGVGVGGKMLYDKLTAGPAKEKSEHAGMMSNTGSAARPSQAVKDKARENLKNMILRQMFLENQQKFGPSK